MATRGRPPKPIEQKRLIGNPGRRPLPDENTVMLLPAADKTPEPSRPLGKPGRELWNRIWEAGVNWISPNTDSEILLMTCEMVDERWALRAKVLREEDSKSRRHLHQLTKMIVENLSLLGFTPADRSRLGVAEVKAKSKLEELMARRNDR
jgi:hypothetical protein